jgi:hypothetical protein
MHFVASSRHLFFGGAIMHSLCWSLNRLDHLQLLVRRLTVCLLMTLNKMKCSFGETLRVVVKSAPKVYVIAVFKHAVSRAAD